MDNPTPLRVCNSQKTEIDSSFETEGKAKAFRFCRVLHFTVDVDWIPGSEVGLERLLEFCDRWKLRATIFFAGRFAECYPDLVHECRRRGHELGTHGWEHGGLERDEDCRSASYDEQRAWIRRATEAVEKASGVRPFVFRAPNLWISETTLQALEDEGYHYDSSVPARRFDLGFGRVHYLKYFNAPVELYRPSREHMGTSGTSSVVEIPPAACLFPINMATLRVLRLQTLKWMVRWHGRRSRHMVFYCHPSEFVDPRTQLFPPGMSWWNRLSMCPRNIGLLEGFVNYVKELGYDSGVFSDLAAVRPGTPPSVVSRGPARQIIYTRTYTHIEEGWQ